MINEKKIRHARIHSVGNAIKLEKRLSIRNQRNAIGPQRSIVISKFLYLEDRTPQQLEKSTELFEVDIFPDLRKLLFNHQGRSMRILYDGVIYRIQRYGGVVRYFNGLIRNLPVHVHPTLISPNQPAYPPAHPNLSTYIETCGPLLWPIKPLRKQIIATRTFNRIKFAKPDVIHPTYYYNSTRNLAKNLKTPVVLTVYDLIHERFPAQMDPYGKQVKLKQSALNRADAIICISESTKNDLLRYYQIAEDRISIVYPGCDFKVQNSPQEIDSTHPYILFVGERRSYKNFDRFVEAFSTLHLKHPDLRVRCVGGAPFSHAEIKKLSKLGVVDKVTREKHLPDEEMQTVYSQAVATIYPSLYEGFGIPILEAMSCGTAVLTSDRASMPEVARNAAIYFDPYSIDAIAESIEQVLDSERRTSMIRRGFAQAKKFSWNQSAFRTAEIYAAVSGTRMRAAA